MNRVVNRVMNSMPIKIVLGSAFMSLVMAAFALGRPASHIALIALATFLEYSVGLWAGATTGTGISLWVYRKLRHRISAQMNRIIGRFPRLDVALGRTELGDEMRRLSEEVPDYRSLDWRGLANCACFVYSWSGRDETVRSADSISGRRVFFALLAAETVTWSVRVIPMGYAVFLVGCMMSITDLLLNLHSEPVLRIVVYSGLAMLVISVALPYLGSFLADRAIGRAEKRARSGDRQGM